MQQLKSSLSLFQITFLGVGTMVGAGIYVLVGKVAGVSGSFSLWAFVAAAFIVLFSAYSHGFLAKHIPSSAGAAEYVNKAFHSSHLTLVVGIGVLLTGVASCATLANGFFGYLSEFVALPKWLVISLVLGALLLVAVQAINTSANFAVAVTFLELLGLVLVIVFARSGNFEPALQTPSASLQDMQLVLAGAFVAFYAYVGFEDMVNLAEEVKQPHKHMLPAVMLALLITTCLYLLVAWVALHALPIDELARSDAPFADMLSHTPWLAKSISLIGLIAIINGALIQVLMGSRMLFGLSRNKQLPDFLNRLNSKQIPINATLVVIVMVWVFALALPLLTLAKLTSGIILVVFTLVNAAAVVIAMRKAQYGAATIATIGAVLCVVFVASALVGGQ